MKSPEIKQKRYDVQQIGGKMKTDLIIIGGGPAGMAAALAAYEKGIRDLFIREGQGAGRNFKPVYPQWLWAPHL